MPQIQFQTPRMLLRTGELTDAPRVVEYLETNRSFHGPFDPKRPEEHFTTAFWEKQLEDDVKHAWEGSSLRLLLFEKPIERVSPPVGFIHFSNVIRGIFQACHLGFSLDEHHQGKGLMTEGLRAAIAFAFDEWNLHRIQAAHLSDNRRSAALLKRVGFTNEGIARHYLRINGEWRDHVIATLVNDRWRDA